MICSDIQQLLPLFLSRDLAGAEAARVQEHLQSCALCRGEKAALEKLQGLLDRIPETTDSLDIGRLYRQMALRDQLRARTWRRIGLLTSVAAAALLILLVGWRCELRWEPHQIVLRWGGLSPAETLAEERPAKARPESSQLPAAERDLSIGMLDQLHILSELIQGLADESEAHDRRSEMTLVNLQVRIDALQRQVAERYTSLERDVAALCANDSTQSRRGTVP
jgi:hypothetical protein